MSVGSSFSKSMHFRLERHGSLFGVSNGDRLRCGGVPLLIHIGEGMPCYLPYTGITTFQTSKHGRKD